MFRQALKVTKGYSILTRESKNMVQPLLEKTLKIKRECSLCLDFECPENPIEEIETEKGLLFVHKRTQPFTAVPIVCRW